MTSEETPPAKTRNQRAHGQLTAFHFEQLTLVEKQLNAEAKEKKVRGTGSLRWLLFFPRPPASSFLPPPSFCLLFPRLCLLVFADDVTIDSVSAFRWRLLC